MKAHPYSSVDDIIPQRNGEIDKNSVRELDNGAISYRYDLKNKDVTYSLVVKEEQDGKKILSTFSDRNSIKKEGGNHNALKPPSTNDIIPQNDVNIKTSTENLGEVAGKDGKKILSTFYSDRNKKGGGEIFSSITNNPPQTDIVPQNDVKGFFGEIYTNFRHKYQEAKDMLIQKKSGDAVGALEHKELGDIDLVWGKEGTGESDGYGLSKLIKFHPEVVDDLDKIIYDMPIVSKTDKRIQLESPTHQAAIRLNWDGETKHWLLTAFKKEESGVASRTDIGKLADGMSTPSPTDNNIIPQNDVNVKTSNRIGEASPLDYFNSSPKSDIIPQTGEFGTIYSEFKGKPQEAIDHLLKVKNGEAQGALYNKDVGEIDLVWGDETKGLKHIYERRLEQWKDKDKVERFIRRLPEIIEQGVIDPKQSTDIKKVLVNPRSTAVVRLEYKGRDKKWLVSAYVDRRNASNPITQQVDSAQNLKAEEPMTIAQSKNSPTDIISSKAASDDIVPQNKAEAVKKIDELQKEIDEIGKIKGSTQNKKNAALPK